MAPYSIQSDQDEISYLVSRQTSDIDGFCHEYPLRCHKHDQKANEGSFRCREDWARYVGPLDRWANCNPYHGNFVSLVLPLCKPGRLALISYFCEYAFLLDDNFMEPLFKARKDAGDMSEIENRTMRAAIGSKKIESKILLELLSTDKLCAEVVVKHWKSMVETITSHDKRCIFDDIEEFVKYRVIDAGVPWFDTLMRFGMGFVLSEEEEKRVGPIASLCYAAAALANDFYSFDVEWDTLQGQKNSEQPATMTNIVWLYMQRDNLSAHDAKERARQVIRGYEKKFLQEMHAFIANEEICSPKLRIYLTALALFIPGNVTWSMSCPRYNPELCTEAEALLQSDAKPSYSSITRSLDSCLRV